jgi:uncharacterized protein (DUF1697 family)
MIRQIALLRGVNLGKRKVVMSELRELCEGAGFTDVRTLLASGNLVLRAKLKGARLEAKLEALIRDGLGLQTDVFVRTADEVEAVIDANPFRAFAKSRPSFLLVNFMRGPVSNAEVAALRASARGEEWAQGEGCVYIKYPDGQGQSRLKLPRLGTARNWNTVTKLAAMARGE